MQVHVSVDEIDRYEKCLRQQLKLSVDVEQPVDKDRAHVLVYLRLALHVGGVWLGVAFGLLHVRLDLVAVLGNVVDVRQGGPIYFVDI
jgi:hypothetical protein